MAATPVESRMVQRAQMLCRILTPGDEARVNVVDLLRELESRGYSRLPFVDPEDRFVYIAHRSMLDQFVARQVLKGNSANVPQLTLDDMFADSTDYKAMFSGTAAFVSSESTLAEARAAMMAVPNCYDVFVTRTGGAGEPILGWLTDVTLEADAD
jgi:hypothetical protein